jgi:acyl carrier protein
MNVETLLAEVMQRPLPPVTGATALKDIAGWDSVVMVRLMLRLEERAGRELGEAELEAIVTVEDVARLIG